MLSLNKKEIALIVEELRGFILGSRIENVIEPQPLLYLFILYSEDRGKHNLLVSIKKRELRIHLITKNKRSKKRSSPFISFLKKHIVGSYLTDINILNEDRIVELCIERKNRKFYIIFEFFEVRANIYVLSGGREIMYSLSMNKGANEIGAVYSFPERSKYEVRSFIAKEEGKLYNQTIDRHFFDLIAKSEYRSKYKLITTALSKKIAKNKRTLNKIAIQLEETKKWEDWQMKGELIKSSIHLIKEGQPSVRVINYFDSELSYINIALDKNKSIRENMEFFFNKAKKFKGACKYLSERLEGEKKVLCELELIYEDFTALGDEYREGVLHSFDSIVNKYRDNTLVSRELSLLSSEASHTIKRAKKHTSDKIKNKDYMTFSINGGKTAYVGRSARGNDKLSFSKASGNDLWLHTRDMSGSHVVVPLLRGESINGGWLLDAALLALVYSKASSSGEGEVMYTRRKFISKAKGLPAGKVYVSSFKTLFIRYDEKRMQAIRDRNKV